MKRTASYNDKMHLRGALWDYLLCAALLMVPVLIGLHNGVSVSFKAIMSGLVKVAPLFYAAGVIEIVAYTPLLGTGGMYLSFSTGNISNLKLPCALAGMETARVKPGTEEGEVITTISIAVSSIVTVLMLAIFVLPLRSLLPYLTAEGSPFASAIRYVIPALFGALGASYFKKHWRISILPIVVMFIIFLLAGTQSAGNMIFVGVIVALVGTFVMYKKGLL